MSLIHFLNVREGDCSVIEHNSDRITVIDVCNAKKVTKEEFAEEDRIMRAAKSEAIPGNFQQKKYPVNPILYLREHSITSVFRFIATHPDMDHLDGIESFFDEFSPTNFWDTDNNAEKDFSNGSGGRYKESDWDFYKNLRDSNPQNAPKRHAKLSGESGKYWNEGDGNQNGDGIHILAPTNELMAQANECGKYNDSSYVLLYRTADFKIIFGGDAEDDTWEHILSKHSASVKDIDLLIAPHHGRDSGRSYKFLDHLKPKMTFFGNARSEHLAYAAWNSRNLPFITNNQANCMVVEATSGNLDLYVTHENYAKRRNPNTFYSSRHRAYYCEKIT